MVLAPVPFLLQGPFPSLHCFCRSSLHGKGPCPPFQILYHFPKLLLPEAFFVLDRNSPFNFDNLLTIPDFYIETEQIKLCIYADGHTYHERTENQALRDKNIDRMLQKLGFKVLRYTGKEIRQDCEQVVLNIKSHME